MVRITSIMPHYTHLDLRSARDINLTQRIVFKRRLLRRWTLPARKERLHLSHPNLFISTRDTILTCPEIHFHVYRDLNIERLDRSTKTEYHHSNNATTTTNNGSYNSSPASIRNTACKECHGAARGNRQSPPIPCMSLL